MKLNRTINFFKSSKIKILKFAPSAALVSIIGDILNPIAAFTIYILIISLVVFFIVFFFYIKKINLRERLKSPLIFFLALVWCSGLIQFQSPKYNNEMGSLANIFPPIQNLQTSLGIVQEDISEIKETTKRIEENTKQNVEETTPNISKSNTKIINFDKTK